MPAPAAASRKEESHDRIVQAAARALRARGYGGVGVAEVMGEAGLTHGGFYAHFPNRAALLAEAVDRAAADGLEALREVAATAPAGKGFRALVNAYLSDQHLHAPGDGCHIAATGTELPRQPPAVREAAAARIRELVALIESQLPPGRRAATHEDALAALAALVGSIVLARAVGNDTDATAVRRATARALRRLETPPEPRA